MTGGDPGPGWHAPAGGHCRTGPVWPRRRHHPAGLAGLVAVAQVAGTILAARGQSATLDPLGYASLAAGGLALLVRYRAPLVALAVSTGTTVIYAVAGYPDGPTFLAVIVALMFAAKAGHRVPAWGIVGAGYAAWVGLALPGLDQAALVGAWAVGLLLLGEAARVGAQQRAQAERTRAEQVRARGEQRRRQASEERLRIAQELHDVLGHHLSLINVQAGVGLHLMADRPEQARAALSTIKQASAEALREVRAVLATLYPDDAAAPREPVVGLDQVRRLTVDAGIPVRTSTTGRVRPLPAEVDRAGYRIVREALTNVRRHAGPGASAEVVIEYREEELRVTIDDDGAGAAPAGEGSGIQGMRERATALGGSLVAGTRPERGFRVRARLPLPGTGVTA